MMTLEAFRVLLTDSRIASGQAANTIEFHWYAGEEAGLLGSGDIFNKYSASKRDIKAMLNQDMTGFVRPETKAVMGIITDNVDASLTAYLKKVIAAVSWASDSRYCFEPNTDIDPVYQTTGCGHCVWLRLLRSRFCQPCGIPCRFRRRVYF